MRLISNTLILPTVHYESRAACIEGYDYPTVPNNALIYAQGVNVLCLEDVGVLGIGDIIDMTTWTPVFEHQELFFFPNYVSKWFVEGKRQRLIYDLLKPEKKNLRCIHTDSVVTVIHFNCAVYGHFLLEIVPKLFVLKKFFEESKINPVPPIALPTNIKKWVKNYILEVWPECNVLWFDPDKEFIAAKFTYVVAGRGFQRQPVIANHFLGFAKENESTEKKKKTFTQLTHQFFGYAKKHNSSVRNRKIFLTRPRIHFSKRNITNFKELKKIAINKGYEVIEPKSFGSLKEQAVFFSQCAVVLGEFTSALHNTIFSPPGTVVGCINYRNNYQESIASVIGHSLTYILPDSGSIQKDVDQSYHISEQKFTQLIDDIEIEINSKSDLSVDNFPRLDQ